MQQVTARCMCQRSAAVWCHAPVLSGSKHMGLPAARVTTPRPRLVAQKQARRSAAPSCVHKCPRYAAQVPVSFMPAPAAQCSRNRRFLPPSSSGCRQAIVSASSHSAACFVRLPAGTAAMSGCSSHAVCSLPTSHTSDAVGGTSTSARAAFSSPRCSIRPTITGASPSPTEISMSQNAARPRDASMPAGGSAADQSVWTEAAPQVWRPQPCRARVACGMWLSDEARGT
eukprot:360919-Chlamydomonas_euryale.AAC.8